ncbi:MAG: hypothetical protein EB023_15400, partial [Flavobacteriia bacterium]|nr:hypothetical protein [Flavobacteriia bacterium]
RSKQEVFKQLGIPLSTAKTILFAPDPLSNAGGAKKYGTDEVAILVDFLKVLGEIEEPILLLLKAHPNQSIEYLKNGLQSTPNNVRCFLIPPQHDVHLNELIQHSHLVVGIFSNLLVEAECLGAKVLRLLFQIKVADPLSRFPNLKIAKDAAEIKKEILKIQHYE